jgi:hypothetical protein
MRTLISALAAAGVLVFALPGYSADDPYTAKPGVQKPGRAAEGDPVKQGGPTTKPGRAAQGDPVKQGGPTTKPGRAAHKDKQ